LRLVSSKPNEELLGGVKATRGNVNVSPPPAPGGPGDSPTRAGVRALSIVSQVDATLPRSLNRAGFLSRAVAGRGGLLQSSKYEGEGQRASGGRLISGWFAERLRPAKLRQWAHRSGPPGLYAAWEELQR
jgi:hypothetical protein